MGRGVCCGCCGGCRAAGFSWVWVWVGVAWRGRTWVWCGPEARRGEARRRGRHGGVLGVFYGLRRQTTRNGIVATHTRHMPPSCTHTPEPSSCQPASRQHNQHLAPQMDRCLVLVISLSPLVLLVLLLGPVFSCPTSTGNPPSPAPTPPSAPGPIPPLPNQPAAARLTPVARTGLTVPFSGSQSLSVAAPACQRFSFVSPEPTSSCLPHLATYQERQPPAHHVHATGTSARTTRCLLTRHPITLTHAFNFTAIPTRNRCSLTSHHPPIIIRHLSLPKLLRSSSSTMSTMTSTNATKQRLRRLCRLPLHLPHELCPPSSSEETL